MLLKLKKTLLLSGLGLIAIGAISPVIASCSKKSKVDAVQEPIYDAAVVQSLFEQFVESYRALALSKGFDDIQIENEIERFETQYEEQKIEFASIYSESEVFVETAKWVKDKAASYDIVLVEWSNVENNRVAMRESALSNGGYSDEITYAANLQDDLLDQGVDSNESFNDYVDNVVDYSAQENSAFLFPRSHGYTLRASKPINSKVNAVAAKANLLSQTIGTFLQLSEQNNILSYFATNTIDSIFEQDGIITYNSNGAKLDYSQTTTQIVGEDGVYLNAADTAYRILTPTAAAALFNYSYLDFDLGDNVRSSKPFDGTKIFNGNTYSVQIALHVQSPNKNNARSGRLLSFNNYESLVSTFEYDVIVTDTKDKFSIFKDDNKTRYEDTDLEHKINYFSLVGSRTLQTPIPADISTDHGSDYLRDTLKYANTIASIVNAFGSTFPNIKKTDRASNGRPKEDSKLDNELVERFYYASSAPLGTDEVDSSTSTDEVASSTSFTERYGSNGVMASVVGKWLSVEDADAALRLQLKFNNSSSMFAKEYINTIADPELDPTSLKISEVNSFLKDVLGEGILEFGIKIEDADDNSPTNAPGSDAHVKLGVYLASTKTVGGEKQYTPIVPIATHNNETTQYDEKSNLESIGQEAVSHPNEYYKLYFPLFLSESQAADTKFCNDLLLPENLVKHQKVIDFINPDNVQKLAEKLDELYTLNKTYWALSISMVILYGLKAIFDAITIACSWFNPFSLISAIIQLASDIVSIVFLSIQIYDTGETMEKLEKFSKVFNTYLAKTRESRWYGYMPIKGNYDAYTGQLNIFKTASGIDSLNAAARAHKYYNDFMDGLCENLFDFVNDSIRDALDIDPEFDGGFQWNMFKGTNTVAPFVVGMVLRIVALILLNVFIKVAGLALKVAGEIVQNIWLAFDSLADLSGEILIQFSDSVKFINKAAAKMTLKYLSSSDKIAEFTARMAIVKPMMKISGIAGVILSVMDMLFSVGYAIAVSVIAGDVNDLLKGLA